ncbi:Uncharacterized protein Fot_49306 [Forsythia ovata]|uniref:Uncharacterized protein n=1 Tax=Forsythia ovata TaxID=205694 RepID=A0ABD1QBI9_9LAMI
MTLINWFICSSYLQIQHILSDDQLNSSIINEDKNSGIIQQIKREMPIMEKTNICTNRNKWDGEYRERNLISTLNISSFNIQLERNRVYRVSSIFTSQKHSGSASNRHGSIKQ